MKDGTEDEVELDLAKIAQHYKSKALGFYLDLLSSLPFEMLIVEIIWMLNFAHMNITRTLVPTFTITSNVKMWMKLIELR